MFMIFIAMVKAKELKVLRKALDVYHKSTIDPLDELLFEKNTASVEDTNTADDDDVIPPGISVSLFGNKKFRIVSSTNAKELDTVDTSSNSNGSVNHEAMNNLSISSSLTATKPASVQPQTE